MRKFHYHYDNFTTIRDPANVPITVSLRKCYTTVHYTNHVVFCYHLMALFNNMHDVTVYFMAACTSVI